MYYGSKAFDSEINIYNIKKVDHWKGDEISCENEILQAYVWKKVFAIFMTSWLSRISQILQKYWHYVL